MDNQITDNKLFLNPDKENIFLFTGENITANFILIVSIILGIYFRLVGLGKWPLAVDEYYIVKSVQNILQHGVPKFINGGFYERGILYQYLCVPLFLVGIKTELAVRIIPAILNILCIPVIYILAKKISGKFLASIVLFVFCFSVWEVEFARFGRMYAPFQFLFLLYLLFLYKTVVENNSKSRKWLYIISITSIFVYEGSVFLAALNFLPVLWDNKEKTFDIRQITKGKIADILISLGIIIFIYIF